MSTDVESYLPDVLPEATSFELVSSQPGNEQYLYSASSNTELIGYVTSGQGQGYGGPINVLVSWTTDGVITNILVSENQETPSWYNRLYTDDYFSQYIGREFSGDFILGQDIDGTTRATFSSRGIAQGVFDGRLLLAEHLGQPYTVEQEALKLGLPQYLLIIGIALVVVFRLLPGLKRLNWPRYLMLVYGLAVFGLLTTTMLSLINFIVFPLGFATSPLTNPSLYILVFGIIGLALLFGKNFWCFWICPFCALQEGAHFLGGSKKRPVTQRQLVLRNTRYFILWAVVMLVLILRQPQLAVFEPWNTIFAFEGDTTQWLLVLAVLGVGMFIYDFWCHYICPVGATMDIVLKIRMWTVNTFGRLLSR
ncbi:MAG: 4Fe-4S binding protein [Dehalogenimonas sp.]